MEDKEFKPKTQDEIKAEVIEDLGGEDFDLEANADKVERITQRRLRDEEMKTSLHDQKVKAKAKLEEKGKVEETVPPVKKEEINIKEQIRETLDEISLSDMDLSDSIKAEIKKISKISGVTVKKALSDPYIQFKLEEEKRNADNSAAALNSGNNKPKPSKNFDTMKPSDFDLSTEDGRKGWEEYKKAQGMV